jgi:hypothetical protein
LTDSSPEGHPAAKAYGGNRGAGRRGDTRPFADCVIGPIGSQLRIGWLLFSHLARVGPDATQKLRERVVNEISRTFISCSTHEISLAEALDPDAIRSYGRMATGEKYMLVPSK